MDISLQIKSLLSQAELYRSQGLFTEAKDKYQAASAMILKIEKIKNKESLLKAISAKIQSIEDKTEKVAVGPTSPELSEKGQNLIKNLFGQNELEKAVALARFGQFERAIVELETLIKDESYRVEAGKNILRCKIALGSMDDAIEQYHQWLSGDLFSVAQLESVRAYLQPLIDRKGVAKKLPAPQEPAEEAPADEIVFEEPSSEAPEEIVIEQAPEEEAGIEFDMPDSDEEILDITSIGITFTSGPHQGKMVEFDVNFQSGGMLSLIVSKSDRGLIDDLNRGDKLEDVQYFSPIAMFKGTAVVANKTQIETGPKQGDFCLDVKVIST